MAKRVKQKPKTGSFVMLCLYAVLLAAALVGMLFIFAKDPSLAPPGVCKYIALAVPALTLLLVIVAMFQRMADIRRGEE